VILIDDAQFGRVFAGELQFELEYVVVGILAVEVQFFAFDHLGEEDGIFVFHGRPDGLRIAPDPHLFSREAFYAWLEALARLPVALVLPTHGPPAPDGPDVIRAALAREPWQLPGSG